MTKKEFFAKAAIAIAAALIKPQDESVNGDVLNPTADACKEVADAACEYAKELLDTIDVFTYDDDSPFESVFDED